MSAAYGLIGEKLEHSFSPQIHAMLGGYEYRLYPLPPEELPGFVRSGGLAGFNVTIPYKQQVMPLLDDISETARAIGAVNTVTRRADGTLFGDNTDAYGFERMLGDVAALKGEKALVLGSGGAAQTALYVLARKGFKPVTISRSGPDNYRNLHRHADAAVVVNTTPVGMYPDNLGVPLSLTALPNCRLVLDMVYNPLRTSLVLEAESLGIPARNGLMMLVAQAQRASQLWGLIPETDDRADALHDTLARRMRSVALIGMPGSGKTMVGRALSRLTGRPFHDTDDLLQKLAGMPIPQIFEQQGEDAFRRVETRALKQVAALSGCVIATGGGVVTRPENLSLLRQNCAVVYLRRPLEQLTLQDRPLSAGRGVKQLFAERRELYENWADLFVDNTTPERAAQTILEELL